MSKAALVAFVLIPIATAGAQELNAATIDAAIESGVRWLATQMVDDGYFHSKYEDNHKSGVAALGMLTLLKCGVPPDNPAIEKGFELLRKRPLTLTYDVAITVLAIEARYKPPEEVYERAEDKPRATVTRRAFEVLAPKRDKQLLYDCVQFLIENQKEDGGWRYPGGEGTDNSATQYAMLAIKAARRLGCDVPSEIFVTACERFLSMQQEDGPAVDWFLVPAAEGPIDEYVRPDRRRDDYDDMETEERPQEIEGTESANMRARGFGYRDSESPNGSMTAAGLACLVICKSELESRRDTARYFREKGALINAGIRDAAAWLAANFAVDKNPKNPGRWNQYYLYGLERAGILIGTYKLGEKDWYEEGARHLLATQTVDGSWLCTDASDSFVDTCFSLLFLKRATVPLLKIPPPRVVTGE